MKKKLLVLQIIVASLVLVTCGAEAAKIVYVGADIDGAAAMWRTSSAAKSLDIDGDNVYGTYCAVQWRVLGTYSSSTIEYVGGGAQYQNAGYPLIDNISVPGTDILISIALNTHTFRVGTSAPLVLRVGVMHDCLTVAENAADMPMQLSIELDSDPTGTVASTMTAQADFIPDIYFFDIIGAQPGQTYTIRGTNTPPRTQTPHHGPVTWDVGNRVPALNPAPANVAKEVATDVQLGWTTGLDPATLAGPNPAITKHFVYISNGNPADANLVQVAAIEAGSPPAATAAYTPSGLQRDGTYYWRIDERLQDDANIIKGYVWKFETILSTPVINTNPANAYVFANENAVFTVAATNPFTGDSSGLRYQWYKGLPGTTTNPVGTDSATLTITNAQLADEASYYCRVKIVSNNKTTDSTAAMLTIKRLMGHWPFDGNLNDAVGTNHGTAVGTPDLTVAGKVGSNSVKTSVGNYLFVPWTPTPNLSISFWALPEANTGSDYIIGCGNPTGAENFFARIVASTPGPDSYDVAFNGGTVRFAYLVYPRDWNYLVVTYDAAGTAKWYVNGLIVGTLSPLTLTPPIDSQIYVGNRKDGGRRFTGRIDDLKLYNYALSYTEVAQSYYAVTNTPICALRPALDYNNDCRVTVDDLVMLITDWMKCGLYPDCITTIP